MANSGLAGPFPLDSDAISKYVTKESPGAYALGDMKHDGLFHIERVGRSDVDVADRLADHIGLYPQFKFGYFASPKAAFEKECHLYHDFSPPDNHIHPDRPNGSDWKCPRCWVFG